MLLRNIGKLSFEDANALRKIMSKSLGQEVFSSYKDKFIEGAVSQDISRELADKIWTKVSAFGSWSFNKSHAVSYTMLSFWCMWFKMYYPVQYYWAIITSEADEKQRSKLISEVYKNGIGIYPPDVNNSDMDWKLESDGIRAGLKGIKGIGQKACEEIIKKRPYSDLEDIKSKCERRIVNKRVIETIENHGLVDGSASFESMLDRWTKLEKSGRTHRINDLYWVDDKNRNVKIAGYVTRKDLYDIYEEDRLRGISRDYSNSEFRKFANLVVEDETGQLRAKITRMDYPGMENIIWNTDESIPLLITGRAKKGRKDLEKVTKLEEIS